MLGVVALMLVGVVMLVLGAYLASRLKGFHGEWKGFFLILSIVCFSYGALFVGMAMYLSRKIIDQPKSAPGATKVVEVPKVILMKKHELTGTVTGVGAIAPGQGTVILVVKLDPSKDIPFEAFVPAIAPSTLGGNRWAGGEKVKVTCYSTICLTNMNALTKFPWFVQ